MLTIDGERYFVDGYSEIDGKATIWSFAGCFFHGHIEHIEPDIYHPYFNCTINHLYNRTLERIELFRKNGYEVILVWECQWKKLQECHIVKVISEGISIEEPLNPRLALYGGRVNAFKLFYSVKEGEGIRYMDFKSLYPFVQKTKFYPLGHPEIILTFGEHPHESLLKYKGLFNCYVIPPSRLYIPLLPYRSGGKLMFPLCRTCADENNQNSCSHTERERIIKGVYTHIELMYAVENLGYKIKKIIEVWSWTDWRNDMFKEYINNFFTIKEQASGWPDECNTEEERRGYLEKMLSEEGVSLNPQKIVKSEGLRSLAKLMLNRY